MVKAILPVGDPRSPKLIRQVEQAPRVNRAIVSRSKYEATIPYVKDPANLIDIEADVISPPLKLLLTESSRLVSFRIVLLRGGFLHRIEGESLEGSDWDTDWQPTADSVIEAARTTSLPNWLPTMISSDERQRILGDLGEWLGTRTGLLSKLSAENVSVRTGSHSVEIADCERRIGMALPREYRELLGISDGLTVQGDRPLEIYGTKDLYRAELRESSSSYWVITDLYDDGAVVMPSGGSEEAAVYLARPSEPLAAISTLRTYVYDSITRLHRLSDITDV